MYYTPLRISTVKPLRELTFDLYIFFKEQYLCYVKKGDKLTEEKYSKLKVQKVAKFFITEEDEINYQEFLDALLSETLADPRIHLNDKVSMVEGAATSAVERMQQNPGSESAYRMTESAAKSLRQVIKNNPEALKKIFGKKVEKNEDIIKHSLNVCALAVKVAENCRCNEQDLNDLGTAALIHDIAIPHLNKKDIPLFHSAKKVLSTDDKRVYNSHCKDASVLLKEKPYVNNVILELVANHEEGLNGLGPLRKKKLTKLEEILSMVNNYDKRIITNKTNPLQTMKDMMIEEVGNYNLDMLNELKKALQAEGLLL
jgi:HD-GYP domain-containing protein (c-di-GMP phosphodiesterase class II)